MIQQFILDNHLNSMRLAGRQVGAERSGDRVIAVHNPYTAEVIGTVPKAGGGARHFCRRPRLRTPAQPV